MKKLTYLLILVTLILLVPASIKFMNQQVDRLSKQAVTQIPSDFFSNELTIRAMRLQKAQMMNFHSIRWSDISATIDMKKKNDILPPAEYGLHIDRIDMDISSILTGAVGLKAKGITLLSSEKAPISDLNKNLPDGLNQGGLTAEIPVDIFAFTTLLDQARQWIKNAGSLLTEGKTVSPIYFSGIASFHFKNQPVRTRIKTQRDRDGYFTLVLNKEVFKTIGWALGEELTDAETELLSANPYKMKRLLNIMQRARVQSKRLSANEALPEDAYRHVLWSYLLTQKFGAEFAKSVTDAHEIGDETNTEAEHQMDYKNNAIGREYALKGYKEEQILLKLLNDRRVIRTPR